VSARKYFVPGKRKLCRFRQVIPNARLCKALLDRITDRAHILETGGGSDTRLLLQALRARVCAHLELDPKIETAEPGDGAQFALLQTIEEHMPSGISIQFHLGSRVARRFLTQNRFDCRVITIHVLRSSSCQSLPGFRLVQVRPRTFILAGLIEEPSAK